MPDVEVKPVGELKTPERQEGVSAGTRSMMSKLLEKGAPEPEDKPHVEDPALPVEFPDDIVDPEPEVIPEVKEKEIKEEKGNAAFKTMREKLEKFEKLSKDLEEKLKDRPLTAKEVEDLKKERDEFKTKYSQYDILSDPDFQEKFTKPIAEKSEKVALWVKQFGGDEALTKQLLNHQLSIKDRMALMKQKTPDAVMMVAPILAEIEDARVKAGQAARESAKTLQALMAEKAGVLTGKTFDATLEKLTNYHLIRKSKTDEKWNKDVEARVQKAKDLAVKSRDPGVAIELAIKAALTDDYAERFFAERRERIKLEEQLGKRKKAVPKLGGGGNESGGKDTTGPKKFSDITQALLSRA